MRYSWSPFDLWESGKGEHSFNRSVKREVLTTVLGRGWVETASTMRKEVFRIVEESKPRTACAKCCKSNENNMMTRVKCLTICSCSRLNNFWTIFNLSIKISFPTSLKLEDIREKEAWEYENHKVYVRVAETAEGTARRSGQGMSKETAALVECVISKMATESAKVGWVQRWPSVMQSACDTRLWGMAEEGERSDRLWQWRNDHWP